MLSVPRTLLRIAPLVRDCSGASAIVAWDEVRLRRRTIGSEYGWGRCPVAWVWLRVCYRAELLGGRGVSALDLAARI
ncbi:unnamed protein product [Bursaphelenchus xylophilus]|uniref:(pine wood nematode) hypothetical protein n=1 Tax=Bursaphelenchus xylophilus TaxID=6326 RepID=A0A1I7SB17_BURXY|nr:unnamed protein product [Bursaphelenchus xylophilus]CAG9105895.1 unnamed protein product [Bursaphelenchus xylophilus]